MVIRRRLLLLDVVVDVVVLLFVVDSPHDFLRSMGVVVVLRSCRFLIERGDNNWWHDGLDRCYYYLHIRMTVVRRSRTFLVVHWLRRNSIAVPPITTRIAVKQKSIEGY